MIAVHSSDRASLPDLRPCMSWFSEFLRHASRWAGGLWKSFSFVGLVIGTLFFAASLTPSLLPRHYAVQGVLSGIALGIGYALGVSIVLFWKYLEIPDFSHRVQRVGKAISSVGVAIVAVVFLSYAVVWQNSIRSLMQMEPVASADPIRVLLIAIVTATLLVGVARGLRYIWQVVDRQIRKVAPRRVSTALSFAFLAISLFLLTNEVVLRVALDAADATFLKLDEAVEEGIEQPTGADSTGSEESDVDWDSIGRQGKIFLAAGPTQAQIEAFAGAPAKKPLRVYVGLRTEEDLEERAKLALRELIRVGGFERSVLIVATPTGTGWLDPGAVDTVEYLHGGDTAIVSMQYSYLPSWITILVDPPRSRESAHALFQEIYGYWTKMKKESRPKLYVHGLSLGSLGSESSADIFTIFEDPIDGGLWSGPPFPSPLWNAAVQRREPDSPMWLPRVGDGSMLRFSGQKNALDLPGARWGSMRFVYLQHASDPMVFFSPELAYRSPEWLEGSRGPDVSPYFRWYPLVTFLQTGFDIPMATAVPTGYGHNYAPANYIDGWIAVTDPPDWSEERTERLKTLFEAPSEP